MRNWEFVKAIISMVFLLGFNTAVANILKTIQPRFPCDSLAPSSVTLTTDAPEDLTVCGSSQWAFDVDYTDGDLYQWEIDDPAMGSVVSGKNTSNVEVLFNNPSGTAEDVDVIVTVTKCGQVLSATLTMHVINTLEYTATPGDTAICAGEAIEFTLSPVLDEYDEVTWDFGEGSTSGDPNTTHTYPNNSSITEFNPVATIVNPEGCMATVVVTAGPVEVVPAPVALVSPAGTLIGCGAFSEPLDATVSSGFGSTANYKWFGPTTSPSPPNCSTCNNWTINEYGTYYVAVENSYGCTDTSNIVFANENCDTGCPTPSPFLVASDSSLITCAEAQVNIEYNPNGTSILNEIWELPDEALDPVLTYGNSGTATASFEEAGVYPFNYNVLYGDGTCEKVFIQNVYVPFVGNMRYAATCGTGSNYDVTIYDHSNIFPAEEGYMVHEYYYKLSGSSWQQITADPEDLSVGLQLAPGEYEFMEIIYSNRTTAAPPCTTAVSVTLPDKPNADFEINSPFEPACVNDVVVQFNNLSTPATGLVHLWDFGDGSTNYQESPGKVFGTWGFGAVYYIKLVVTNDFACKDTANRYVKVMDNNYWDGRIKPDLFMSPQSPQEAGTPIKLVYMSFLYPTPPKLIWYKGNTPIEITNNEMYIEVTESGVYWVMGIDKYGCQVPTLPVSIEFTE